VIKKKEESGKRIEDRMKISPTVSPPLRGEIERGVQVKK